MPLVASPSVTRVRQEKSNYCILASRRACLHTRLSCSAVDSADVLSSRNCQRSEIQKIVLRPEIIPECQTTGETCICLKKNVSK